MMTAADSARMQQDLQAWFASCPGAVVAFSAGVDSSLVAFLARRYLGKDGCLAVISASASLKQKDLQAGQAFAATYNIPLRTIETSELLDPQYQSNPVDRCYHCKKHLYTDLSALACEHPGWWLLGGANADDKGDYRPGSEAAREHAVRAPLAECGLGKTQVRALAKQFGLACWDKPASPCMSSRIPYGQPVTKQKLHQIEAAEAGLNQLGFEVVRVRHFGAWARVEVPVARLEEARQLTEVITQQLRALGFTYWELDPEGLVSGKLNRVLPKTIIGRSSSKCP
jgi:uncharacterized protein